MKFKTKLLIFLLVSAISGGFVYFGYTLTQKSEEMNINNPEQKSEKANKFEFPQLDKKYLIKSIKKNEIGESYIDQEIVKSLIYDLILKSNKNNAILNFDFIQRSKNEIDVYIEVVYDNEKYRKVYEIKI